MHNWETFDTKAAIQCINKKSNKGKLFEQSV